MTTFTRFDTPANLRELDEQARDGWNTMFVDHAAQFAGQFTHYFNPTAAEASTETAAVPIVWSAFPARLLGLGTNNTRWAKADSTRDEQDEYCEWIVARDDAGRILAVTFSTEVPEYWSHIAENNTDLLLALYGEFASPEATLEDLITDEGQYRRDNPWNSAQSDTITHLRQGSNELLAAIRLTAESTVLRHRADGTRITDRQELVRCGGLGEPLRNSDPQIAEVINDAVATGLRVTLADPLGLYLDGLQAAGMLTPDGTDPSTFWNVERGTAQAAVRATFAVPENLGYAVGDITIGGVPIEFGAQVADKVRVRIDGLAAVTDKEPTSQPCEPPF